MAANKELLGELHVLITNELIARIASGAATTADISTAIKFLKDNGVEAVVAGNNRLTELAQRLPDFDDYESEDVTYN